MEGDCFTDRYKGEHFYNEGGETLEQAVHRGYRCPIPGNIQGQFGGGFEQPDLVADVPAHCRGLDLITFNGLFQPKLFCDSIL